MKDRRVHVLVDALLHNTAVHFPIILVGALLVLFAFIVERPR